MVPQATGRLREILGYVDVFVPNERRLCISGMARRDAGKWLSQIVKLTVIKRGRVVPWH